MKKIISILILFSLLCVSPFVMTNRESEIFTSDRTFVLPSSILIVDEEAFAGTPVETVVFPDGFSTLRDRAFSSAAKLRLVYLPGSVCEIGTDAFPVNAQLAIHGVEKSFAQTWADENGIKFVTDDIWTRSQTPEGFRVEGLLALSFILCPIEDECLKRLLRKVGEFLRSMRPQDRPELNPIDYRFP